MDIQAFQLIPMKFTDWSIMQLRSDRPKGTRSVQGGKVDDITVVVARVGEEEVRVPRQQPALERLTKEQDTESRPVLEQ